MKLIERSKCPYCEEIKFNSLYKKMLWFIKNKNKLKSMGRQSREIVVKRFSKQIINAQMIKIITGN